MNKKNLFLIILFIIAVFFRFYKLKELFFFMVDEATVSLVAKRIIVDRRPVLVGTDIPGGLQTGPLFYYLTAVIMLTGRMNPLAEAVFASGLGAVMVFILFYTARNIFSSFSAAWFSVIIYTFSALMVIYNRIYNSLTYSVLATIIAYYALRQIFKNKKNYEYLLSFALILATHSEGTGFSLVLLSILCFIFCRLKDKKIKAIKVFLPFIFSFSSLLVFDLRHNFVLLGKAKDFFSFSAGAELSVFGKLKEVIFLFYDFTKVFSRIFILTGTPNLSCQILPCQYCINETRVNYNSWVLLFCLVILIFFLIYKNNKNNLTKKIIGFHFISMFIGLLLYRLFMPGYFHEWLWAIFFPGFLLMASYFFSWLWRKNSFLTGIIVIFFIVFNIRTSAFLFNPAGLSIKEKAIKYAVEQVKQENFFLDSLGDCYGYGGYRYLFWYYGKAPTHSYVDNLYADWIYPYPFAEAPKLGVVMVNPVEQESPEFFQRYAEYKNKTIESKKFGEIEVLIVNDE